ncbi:DUF1905 domain-containing protein [Mucilaginibacter pallidiroseus]|uniref:DUF1905 domain-containing protein n=1 Tax=Mucilaginibacter pallidiroseus TaxID=2599295 RepID=A0A563U7N6_9SPHI|nr:YdeI/OmpD-associated family protein [Mucilaginibacter pallidiroseus]TWR27346.1 DUF1905 domain-containing protein [Mucilaginibacter pallidiroseus]
MVDFNTIILQVSEPGDKKGWSYIELPADLAQDLLPGNKQAFRVKGKLDEVAVSGLSAMPMGNGNFLLAIKQQIRKALRKEAGAMLRVSLAHDKDFKIEAPDDLLDCLGDEPQALAFFNSLSKSHRGYFIKWINDAKTEQTRANRIAATINATARHMDYGAMLRELKKLRE